MNYIGIDIGDGESCVCVLNASSEIEPRPVAITGRKSFLSAVARDGAGGTLVGMDAVGAGVAQGLSVRFKSRFLTDGGGARDDMRRFLRGVRDAMERGGLLAGEHSVSVGCPAGWRSGAREEYLEMIRAAGFSQPRLVSESRAAFLYAKHARTIQLDPALIEDSALVIDIGSSTLDFAHVVDGRETNVGTFGEVYLGGGAIDEALLQAAVDNSVYKTRILGIFEAAPEWRSYCLLAARRLKEEYFTRQSSGEQNVRCSETVTLMYDDPLQLQLRADAQLILRVVNLPIAALNGMSFQRMLEGALASAREQTRARPPKLVLLTGGASRMRFFQELCRAQFADAQLVLCEEPEFSIAKGLAYSARVDDGIRAFNEAIADYLREDHIHEAVLRRIDPLIQAASGCMADIGYEEAQTHIARWRSGKYATLSEMNRGLGEAIAAKLRTGAAGEAIAAIVRNEMSEVCSVLQPQVDAICSAHGIACSQMRLGDLEDLPRGASGSDLSVRGDMEFLQRSVQALITALVAGVMLLIPGGQVVDLVLVALTALATYVGRDFIGDFTENLNIPQPVRALIPPERIANEKLHENLQKSFCEALRANQNFQTAIAADIEKSLVDYVAHMAKKTEIAIATGGDET